MANKSNGFDHVQYEHSSARYYISGKHAGYEVVDVEIILNEKNENNPITNIDVDGLEGCPSVAGMTGYIGKADKIIGAGSAAASIFNGISAIGKAVGPALAAANLAANVINTASQQSVVKQQLATNSINGSFTTSGAGDVGSHPSGNGNSNASATSGLGSGPPNIEWVVKGLINSGDLEGATNLIIEYYRSDFNFVNRTDYYFAYGSNPMEGGFTTQDESLTAEEAYSGKEEIQFRINAGLANYTDFANGNNSFGQLVRNIWHEVNHIAQIQGIKPYAKMKGTQVHNEREFLAAYREITNTSLPPLLDNEKIGMILGAITDKVTMFDPKTKQWVPYGNYYHKLSADKQSLYLPLYNELSTMYTQLTGKKL